MPRTFRVLKSLGGCGGTIVSRALAAAGGAIVLSEVNPRSANIFAGALNPLVQMNKHHFTLLPDALRAIDVHTLGHPPIFGRFVAELDDALDQPLLIRDYSYVDYIGVPFSWPRPTQACLREALDPFGASRSALLVRHPAACLRSLLGHPPLADVLTPELFVAGHLAFYDDNRDCPVFRFEDFLDAPRPWLEALCAALDLPCNEGWEAMLGTAPALTGNPQAVVADDIQRVAPHIRGELDEPLRGLEGYDRLLALGQYE